MQLVGNSTILSILSPGFHGTFLGIFSARQSDGEGKEEGQLVGDTSLRLITGLFDNRVGGPWLIAG